MPTASTSAPWNWVEGPRRRRGRLSGSRRNGRSGARYSPPGRPTSADAANRPYLWNTKVGSRASSVHGLRDQSYPRPVVCRLSSLFQPHGSPAAEDRLGRRIDRPGRGASGPGRPDPHLTPPGAEGLHRRSDLPAGAGPRWSPLRARRATGRGGDARTAGLGPDAPPETARAGTRSGTVPGNGLSQDVAEAAARNQASRIARPRGRWPAHP